MSQTYSGAKRSKFILTTSSGTSISCSSISAIRLRSISSNLGRNNSRVMETRVLRGEVASPISTSVIWLTISHISKLRGFSSVVGAFFFPFCARVDGMTSVGAGRALFMRLYRRAASTLLLRRCASDLDADVRGGIFCPFEQTLGLLFPFLVLRTMMRKTRRMGEKGENGAVVVRR